MKEKDIITTSFMNWINSQINDQRLSSYHKYEDYYNGDQDIHAPEQVRNAIDSYLGLVDNFCAVIVDTPPEYICGGGNLGIECRHPDGSPYPEAEQIYYQIYEQNGFMFEEILNVLTQSGTFGDSFIRMAINDDNIELYVDRPDQVFPRYMSSNFRNMLWCAYQWFDRDIESTENNLFSKVFYNDRIEYYTLGSDQEYNTSMMFKTQRTNWNLVDTQPNPLGFIPVIHIKNNNSNGLEFGISDLHKVAPLQDMLNKTLIDMYICMDTQAFQRIIFYGAHPSKEKKVLSPGTILEIPDETGHMQVIPSETIAPFLMAIENNIDHICAVSSIPRLTFMRPTGFPMSGYALEIHTYPLDRKCVKKRLSLENGLKKLNNMIAYALALITGGKEYLKDGNAIFGISKNGKSEQWGNNLIDIRDAVTTFKFQGGLPVDRAMQTQINAMQMGNGTMSKYEAMEKQGVENIPETKMIIQQEQWEEFAMRMRMRGIEMGLQDVVEKLIAEQEAKMQGE